MCLCSCLSLCCVYMFACVWVCVHLSPGGRGVCKASSLLSCRVDMQPTDMHSLLLQPQPRPLQLLPPPTVTGMYLHRLRAATAPAPFPPSAIPNRSSARRLPRGLSHAKSMAPLAFSCLLLALTPMVLLSLAPFFSFIRSIL